MALRGVSPRLIGTNTNNNAGPGQIGEYISSTVLSGAAVSLTTGTALNVTSISLTAGDWDVSGSVAFNPNAATVTTSLGGAVNTTADTLPTAPGDGAYALLRATYLVPTGTIILPIGQRRMSLAATTTVYLIGFSVFATNTMAAYGFIGARRAR